MTHEVAPRRTIGRAERFEAAIFVAVWLLLVGCASSRFFRDPGTFWHLAVGREILNSGTLPHSDVYTFTVRGKPWVSQDWLCDLATARLHQIGGWDSLLVVTVSLLAWCYAGLARRLYCAGLAGIGVVFLVALAVSVSCHQFHVRPLILTIVFTAYEFALLADVEQGRRRIRHLWLLVPLCVFWTNIHGGVLGGLGTLGLVATGWVLQRLLGCPGPIRRWHDGLELGGVVALCCLGVLANPYGLDLPRLWFEILRLPLSDLIQEHRPLQELGAVFLATIVLAVVFLAVLASTPPRHLRVTHLMPLVWLMLTWDRGRHSPLFAVITLIALADLLPHSRVARFLAWRGFFFPTRVESEAAKPSWGWQRCVVPLSLVAVSLALQASAISVPLLGRGGVRLDRTHWPTDLLPQLSELNSHHPGEVRIFNEMLYGGFLIFHTPNVPVFVDDRCELFGAAFLRRLKRMSSEDPSEFDRWHGELSFTHALVSTGTTVDAHIAANADWELVKRTPTAALYRYRAD